jgi:flagellar biosynthetic protein FlhB
MADDPPEQSSKTEDPSQKKLEDANKKGDVAKSQEVTTWFMLAGSALMFALMAGPTAAALTGQLGGLIAHAEQFELGGSAFGAFFTRLAGTILVVALIPMIVLAGFAVAGNLVQHQPLLSVHPITPKLSKISPIAGFKRLFSSEALVNFAKGLLKLGVISAVLWFVVQPDISRLETLVTAEPAMILPMFQDMGLKIFGAVLAVVTVIAVGDLVYQRNRWWNRQKMTVQETRDEYKQMEGDPKVKGRIRAIRNERSRKRMMASVPDATVIITNPTHFAVALKYDSTMNAPVCLAKGADGVALRIRELASEHDVPIVENPPLARALFASVEIDQVIPAEHFRAVAQVIGFIMQLQRKPRWKV